LKSAILAPIFSFLLSLGAYGLFLGPLAGFGLLMMLVVHEFGHYGVSRGYKLKTNLPMFIPFVGAWVSHEDPRSDVKNAVIALGGPTAGIVFGYLCLAVWWLTGATSHFWLWMAAAGIGLNLLNLLPIAPLDGGHVVTKFWPNFSQYALAAFGFIAVVAQNPDLGPVFAAVAIMAPTIPPIVWYSLAAGFAYVSFATGSLWYLLFAAACVGVNFGLDRFVGRWVIKALGWVVKELGWILEVLGWVLRPLFDALCYLIGFLLVKFGKATPEGELAAQTTEATEQAEVPAETPAVIQAAKAEEQPLPPPLPLTLAEKWYVGVWYILLLAVSGPTVYWMYTLHAFTLQQ
jgi:Zn-dependent protease